MDISKREKHCFALCVTDLPSQQSFTISDQALARRIQTILRLKAGDECVFFNRAEHVRIQLDSFSRKAISANIIERSRNKKFSPAITFYMPLLKKTALESAIYGLVEVGIQDIQLMITDKSHRSWGGSKERDRLQRIIIAAAEQSKNFAYPELEDPILFKDAVYRLSRHQSFYGSPEGDSAISFFKSSDIHTQEIIGLCIGPEGDFSLQERSFLQAHAIQPMCLTPTILRAETAALCFGSFFRTA